MPTGKPGATLDENDKILHAKLEWEQTFDAVSDLIFIVDNDRTIVRVNRAMAQNIGLSPQELVGRKCFELMHAVNFVPDKCPYACMLEDGKPQTREFVVEKFGRIYEVTMSPLVDEEGNPTACVHVARDITEKKRNEELLALQQKQLEEINSTLEARITDAVAELRKMDDMLIQQSRLTAMGELISNIAHQWRQPLNNVGLIVQSIQLAYKANDLTVEELDTDIAETMKILQQISETIDDFRNFFSYEEHEKSFFVNDILCRALGFIEPSLRRKEIRLKLEEETEVMTNGYPNEYMQAILNVLLNARDVLIARKVPQAEINIRIFRRNGRSVVTIKDNGGGIDENILPKIYDPYFSTKLQNTGVGIGLYMAKMIIEKKMHGSLTARNVDGGAEFMIEV